MCDCVKEVDAMLRDKNAVLVTTLFGDPKVVIQTVKLEPRKRGSLPYMLASYCPFCGEAYAKAGGITTAEAA
jgi:hypothetical protein